MTTAGRIAPRAGLVPLKALMFGIFGAPAAWALQTIADYGLVDFSDCLTVVPSQVRDLRGARFIRMSEMRRSPLRSTIISSAGKTGAPQTVMRAQYRTE